jgi:GNAT superfamily N-acetyltransferase
VLITVRAAADEDMAGVRSVAARFGNLSHWPDRPDYLDLEHAGGGLAVAVTGGPVTVAGFAGVLRRGELTHLGDLFVRPEAQSGGAGRRLLELVLPDAGPRATYASADPRAVALYVRRGLNPAGTLCYLTGDARRLRDTATAWPSTADAVAALDGDASGGDRAAHIAWYADRPGVSIWATTGGYAVMRATRSGALVGPAGGGTPADVVTAVTGALRTSAATTVKIAVFGSSPLLPVLIGAGFRLTDQDTVMLSEPGLLPMDRYVPHPDLG